MNVELEIEEEEEEEEERTPRSNVHFCRYGQRRRTDLSGMQTSACRLLLSFTRQLLLDALLSSGSGWFKRNQWSPLERARHRRADRPRHSRPANENA